MRFLPISLVSRYSHLRSMFSQPAWLSFSVVAVLVPGIALTSLSCSSAQSPIMTTALNVAAPVVRKVSAAPRVKPESARFSKNFFAAFPLVQIKINGGEPLNFLFDTGNAGRSLIDVSVAQKQHLDLVPSGGISFAGIKLPTLRLEAKSFEIASGELPSPNSSDRKSAEQWKQLKDISCDVLDLSAFSELTGRRVDGILGADVIRRFVTTVDYQRQTVIFGKPSSEPQHSPNPEDQAPTITANGNRILLPFTLRDGWIVVKTRISSDRGENFDEEMILDTGAALTTFSRDRARRLNLNLSNAKPTTMVLPIGRLTYLPHRLQEVEFAGVKFSDAASVVVATREGLFTAGNETSLLGANVLRHFRMTIDYGRRQLTLDRVPNEQVEPDEYTSIGVLPKLRDGRYFVSGVVSGSPADDEGIEIGDEITNLDGREIESFSFSELIDALRGPENSKLDITLRRGQRTIALKLNRVKLL